MLYVYDIARARTDQPIALPIGPADVSLSADRRIQGEDFGDDDVDTVDDALLNTSAHNAIEQQLFRGDVVGLALMSGAILWSAMGAFG